MCQKEKMIIVSMISSVLIIVFYSLYIYQKYISGNPEIIHDLSFWGKAFLYFIPVTIVAQILIHIVFAIVNKIATNEDISSITDEMDRLIELKSIRISHWTFILGFIMAMLAMAIGMQAHLMLLILVFSGFISSLASDISKIYFYRKGV